MYVDGSGGEDSAYGYYVLETGESYYKKRAWSSKTHKPSMRPYWQPLEKFESSKSPVVVYSDSRVIVEQLNHEAGTKSPVIREMARKAWRIIAKYADLQIRWMPRGKNLAGKDDGQPRALAAPANSRVHPDTAIAVAAGAVPARMSNMKRIPEHGGWLQARKRSVPCAGTR